MLTCKDVAKAVAQNDLSCHRDSIALSVGELFPTDGTERTPGVRALARRLVG